jgi:hypothetical protein
MLNESDIVSEFKDNYRYAHDYWQPFVELANVATMASSGATWTDAERKQLAKEGRDPIEYNIMRRPLQFFSGYLRDNLNSIVVAPVEGSDQATADQFTKLMYNIWDKENGCAKFLDACDEGFKSGMALTGVEMDYSKDFINGNLSFYYRTYNSFFLDPTFSDISLKDCAFAITRDLVDRGRAKQLLPFVDGKLIDDIPNGFRDDKFLSFHPNFTTISRNRRLVAYDQYYRRITKKRTFLVDDKTGYFKDITDLDKEDKDKLKFGLKRIKDMHAEANALGQDTKDLPNIIRIETVDRGFVELNILLNGQLVYTGEDKTGIVETFPFVPIICYLEPSIWQATQRVQGISQTIYSVQRQFSKRHMKITDMMDTTISTGYKYLIGSVPDPSELQQSGQNRIIGIDPDPAKAPQGLDSVQELRGGDVNASLIEYQKILDDLVLTLANINESVLGVDEGGNTQVSGRLAQVRIAQGLRTNRKIMDNVELSQKILGELIVKAIQSNYTPEKVERIIGERPTDQFYENEFEQYDAVVKQGIRSQSQRDAYYYELVTLKREQIVDVPQSEIIRAMEMAGLSDLQKAIEEQEQQQQQQLAETTAKENALIEATAEEKLALAHERDTRAEANLGLERERESESVQNIALAELDKARAIVEISKLKDDRIIQALEMINQIHMQEMAEKQRVEDINNMETENSKTEAKKRDVQTSNDATSQGGNA